MDFGSPKFYFFILMIFLGIIMSKRKIIKINEKKCNGCGLCIPNCHEGAIQIIDEKARLISDIFCDGLGACIGKCPQGAITTFERVAEPYDDKKTMENIVKAGENTIIAHLKHLKNHGEEGYFKEAVEYLRESNIDIDYVTIIENEQGHIHTSGCPGSRTLNFTDEKTDNTDEIGTRESQLRQWPIQLHLEFSMISFFPFF